MQNFVGEEERARDPGKKREVDRFAVVPIAYTRN